MTRTGKMISVAAMLLAVSPAVAGPPPAGGIDALARDVTRLESLRAVKDLQRSYAQYAQFGLWDEMAALFAARGKIIWGDREIAGREAIRQWLVERGGPGGLAPGALNMLLIDDPLVNLATDGRSAKARWRHMALTGDGRSQAGFEGGMEENDYVMENGRWKIATLHYHPEFEGDYAQGWSNAGGRKLPIIPYHFDSDTMGVPIPAPEGPAPASGVSAEALAKRIASLNEEDAVRNLQHAYGYYVDRKMWDDVADLFAPEGVVQIAGVGTFRGPEGVRKALALMGPAWLRHGELNDRPQFDVMVRVAPGGREAFTRGSELALLGDADAGEAGWGVSVFRNRFVKDGGIWKFREMRIQPIMKADYRTGWGASGVERNLPLPAFLGVHPVTGRAIPSSGRQLAAVRPLTGAIAQGAVPTSRDVADLRRRYQRSLAYDGTVNVSAAYGYFLDDFQWGAMSRLFAVKGNKQSPFSGYYLGRDRIAGASTARYGPATDPSTVQRASLAYHWRVQPVILVSQDGRSTTLRTRLFQPRTSIVGSAAGKPNPNGLNSGMYPNDQFVLEDGVWRLWSITIDEHYFVSPDWKGGWSAAKEPPASEPPPPSPLIRSYPPDVAMTALGRREEGFRGGTGKTITWPGILPMWFHYRNPVSGRTPERFWPDCVPCDILPAARMSSNGYQLPAEGPQVDGEATE